MVDCWLIYIMLLCLHQLHIQPRMMNSFPYKWIEGLWILSVCVHMLFDIVTCWGSCNLRSLNSYLSVVLSAPQGVLISHFNKFRHFDVIFFLAKPSISFWKFSFLTSHQGYFHFPSLVMWALSNVTLSLVYVVLLASIFNIQKLQ